MTTAPERPQGAGSAPRAGIVVTGTEVLAGIVADRNGPWISARLGELGVEVECILVVGDRPRDLASALDYLRDEGVELIVTSGGLGPTADDLTAEVVAGFADRRMRLDEVMRERIAAILADFARRVSTDPEALEEANVKQAMVPEGAIAIDPAGTAPGLVVPSTGPLVVVLPGPPRELQAMWQPALETEPVRAVLARAPGYRVRTMRLFGIPESEIAKTLRELSAQGLDLSQLEITTCLRRAELEVVTRYLPGGENAYAELERAFSDRHGRELFSADGMTIDAQVGALLEGRSIATAESCTAGLLAARLAERPGASAYLLGGIVSYADEAKRGLLGVPAELIEAHGAVSAEVAAAMAHGCLERFAADTACAITGVAGPGGGTERKPVGLVCVCVLTADGRILERQPRLPGDRAEIRDRSTTVALHMLRWLLGD
ncbi:MAG: competence/damage-inducible protein A [Solirubrobacterales bacterium]|nr:competence/damage-inducible protein A [Solirubrobacterales bacterium]